MGGGGTAIDPSQTLQLAAHSGGVGPVSLGGDINVGADAGSGLKFPPLVLLGFAAAAVAGLYFWFRNK